MEIRSTNEPQRGRLSTRFVIVAILALLLIAPLFLKSAAASVVSPGPAVAPALDACSFVPDPRSGAPYACGDPFAPSAFVNTTIRFNVTVSDAEGVDMNVTIYFDRLDSGGVPNVESPTVTVTVVSPGPSAPAYAQVNWSYSAVPVNFSWYFVYVEVRGVDGEFSGSSGSDLFQLYVVKPSPPYLDGLRSTYTGTVEFPDPVIPLVYANVTAVDIDFDRLNITWDWGDGTLSVNLTDGSSDRTDIFATHAYDPGLLPLNETPRIVRFPITVWIDDGIPGHNSSQAATAEFDLDYDLPPSLPPGGITTPSPGARFKVGDTVLMQGTAVDPEGDPIVTYWDFDDGNDTDRDGDPGNDRDGLGPEASHAYPVPGDYNVTFWYSDGETKKFCLDENCTTYQSHWGKQEIPIFVRLNQFPVVALGNHSAVAGQPVLLRVAILDADGDSLLVTWNFGDGTANGTNATVGQRGVPTVFQLFQEHVYTSPSVCAVNASRACPLNLTITAFDGNDTAVVTGFVFVESFNLPPVIRSVAVLRDDENRTAAANSTFLFNSTAVLRLNMTDAEGDPIDIAVDWGDGNVTSARVALVISGNTTSVDVEGAVDECTLNAEDHIVCYFSHVYGDIGDAELVNYTISVTLADGQVYADIDMENETVTSISHVIHDFATVQILHPRLHGLGPWDGWDFGTLAVVLGLPALLVGRTAWRIHKERKEE